MTEVAINLGVLVLAVTLLGVSLGTILSIGAEHHIAQNLHELRPATTRGWILCCLLLFSVMVNFWLLSRLLVRRFVRGHGSLRWKWWRLRVSVRSLAD